MKTFDELPRKEVSRSWLEALTDGLTSEMKSSALGPALKQEVQQAIFMSSTAANQKWTLRNLTTKESVRLYFASSQNEAEMETDPGFWLQFPKCVFVEGSSGSYSFPSWLVTPRTVIRASPYSVPRPSHVCQV